MDWRAKRSRWQWMLNERKSTSCSIAIDHESHTHASQMHQPAFASSENQGIIHGPPSYCVDHFALLRVSTGDSKPGNVGTCRTVLVSSGKSVSCTVAMMNNPARPR